MSALTYTAFVTYLAQLYRLFINLS